MSYLKGGKSDADYRPYISDESDDTDESDESDEDVRIRREQDPRYAILKAPGPNLKMSEKQQEYVKNSVVGAPWDESTNITSLENHVYLLPPKTTKTSLFSIKSNNRDKKLFPTPYNFQIKLPRVYKNVTKFQLVQLSFPNNSNGVTSSNLFVSSFVQKMLNDGVPSTCINTCISIINCATANNGVGFIESGRINGLGGALLTTAAVPDGTYTDPQLAQEMTFQANSTPPLNLISYSTFHDVFTNTRDVSVLFNEPGDTFYSRASNKRYAVHTKENIMETYYTQQHIDGFSTITDKIAFTAYYYPILKEVFATQMAMPFIYSDLPFDEVTQRVLGSFEGLDSDFYYTLCSTNQGALDTYRSHLTFELRNINKYTWIHKNGRFAILHDTLHTSLQRDIRKNYNSALNQELQLAGLNDHSFTSLKSNAISYSAIYKHLETNLSSVFGTYHLATEYKYGGGDFHNVGNGESHGAFSAVELNADKDFTTLFDYTSSIGRIYGNYGGLTMRFRDFADYHSTLSSYYSIVHSTQSSINRIHFNVNRDHHDYVSTKYSRVLPSTMIATQSYTLNQGVPVSFVTNQYVYVPGQTIGQSVNGVSDTSYTNTVIDPTDTVIDPTNYAAPIFGMTNSTTSDCNSICCNYVERLVRSWYSNLPVNTVIGTMPYKLGMINITPNQFNVLSTITSYTSTGNLNFLMQLNDEQGFNNMDIAMTENNYITTETTGQVKLMAAKILMGNVGDSGISQTLIQNPSIFENTLGKLDKLTIKLYYDDESLTPAWLYLPFQYEVNEWNATFQIDEEIGFANQNSGWGNRPSIPIPENPNDTPYLNFTHKNNPNNA
jgi:hypothetical protein